MREVLNAVIDFHLSLNKFAFLDRRRWIIAGRVSVLLDVQGCIFIQLCTSRNAKRIVRHDGREDRLTRQGNQESNLWAIYSLLNHPRTHGCSRWRPSLTTTSQIRSYQPSSPAAESNDSYSILLPSCRSHSSDLLRIAQIEDVSDMQMVARLGRSPRIGQNSVAA